MSKQKQKKKKKTKKNMHGVDLGSNLVQFLVKVKAYAKHPKTLR
jgi:hypothetical protein